MYSYFSNCFSHAWIPFSSVFWRLVNFCKHIFLLFSECLQVRTHLSLIKMNQMHS